MRTICLLLISYLWTSELPGKAQSGSGPHARIVAVTEAGGTSRFKVPQVQMSDAVVAQRINRSIAQRIIEGDEVDTKARLSQQLRQAALECCWDSDERHWISGQGLTGCRYEVLLNEQGLLSFEFTLESTGAYSYENTDHISFDLRTGRQLTLADVVADSPAQLTRCMHGAISRRFGEALVGMRTEADSTEIATVAELFYWDWNAKRVRFQGDPGIAEVARATEPNLESFALTPYELRLYYGSNLPHAMLNYEPDNTYHFPFMRVQPRGLLVPLAARAEQAMLKR